VLLRVLKSHDQRSKPLLVRPAPCEEYSSKKQKQKMSSAAPLSFASLSLEKNQQMPLQAKKKPAAAAAKASPPPAAAEDAAAAASPPPAKAPAAAAAAPAKKPAVAPAAAKPAPKKDASSSPIPDVFDDNKERAVAAPRTHYKGFAMVKAVLSGDSLLLAGSAADPSAEKLISLTGVLAPKFGRGKKAEDEPFAWESREYLRKHVIGQQVYFVVQGSNEKPAANDKENPESRGARYYGLVTLKGQNPTRRCCLGQSVAPLRVV
jgi:hypothetical protein